MSSSPIAHPLTPLATHLTVRKNLLEISEEIHRSNWREHAVITWNVLSERSGRTKTVAYTVLGVTGTLLAVGYSGMAMMFGGLAFKQALDDYDEGEVRAGIIGHLAEWSMLGVFSLQLSVRLIGNSFQLGRLKHIKRIFNRHICDTTLPHEVREQIYLEMQDFRASQVIHHQSVFSDVRTIPNPKKLTLTEDINSTLRVDLNLQPIYDDIHDQIETTPTSTLIKMGWEEIKHNHGRMKSMMLKTVIAAAGIFCLWNLGVYFLGIFWSGQQAVEDLHAGDNPSIGGHALEWGAEVVAMLMLGANFFTEIANVGKAKLITQLFHDQMNRLVTVDGDDIEESGEVGMQIQSQRLFSQMKKRFRIIPEGWFFKLPDYLLYQGLPSEEVAIEIGG